MRRAYEDNSRRKRDELILSHVALVRHILGRMAIHFPPGIDKENLEAAGMLGLVEAAHHYDPAQQVQFKTYAYPRVRGAMLDELRRNSPLPQHMQEKVTLVRNALGRLEAPVTMEQLATHTGLTSDEVADALAASRFVRLLGGEAELDARPDANAEQPDAPMQMREQRAQLARAIEALPLPQRTVVTLYYNEDLRLKEISAVMRLSESRISRLLSAALLTLREKMRAEGN